MEDKKNETSCLRGSGEGVSLFVAWKRSVGEGDGLKRGKEGFVGAMRRTFMGGVQPRLSRAEMQGMCVGLSELWQVR